MKSSMANVAVVYHSGYGHTEKVAKAIAEGVASAGVQVNLVSVSEIDQNWDKLASADGIIFGAPTYMGSVSAPFKEFMDKSSKVWMERGWKDKLAGGFTNSGSWSGDKLNSLVQLAVFAGQHCMVWVGNDLFGGNNSSTASADDLNRTGFFLGVGTQANVDQGADVTPPASDLATARHYGARFAQAAQRWSRGA